jgi:alpha-ribazole phosphatase
MKACLIRHQRVAVPPGLCYGWCDVPLAEGWREEIAGIRAALPWAPREVRCSPAARCRALAEALGAAVVRIDPRLRELGMGEWEGRLWESFRGPESEAWALDPWRRRPPGGESGEDLWRRVAEVRHECLAAAGDGIVIVTHAGVIRAWRGLSEGRSFTEMLGEPVPFGGVHPAG